MSRLRALARFAVEFVVGDDPAVAVGVCAALAVSWLLHRNGDTAWPVLPVAVVVVLGLSLRRALRAR